MEENRNLDYLALLKQHYPEELEPGGFVEWAREHFRYLDKHPEQWTEMASWIRPAWNKDPEATVLKYSYEFLRSFA